MARIFTCAPGLVKLMAGEPWEATRLPKCFQFTQERIKKFNKPKPESRL
jgi:ribosomal protein L40E